MATTGLDWAQSQLWSPIEGSENLGWLRSPTGETRYGGAPTSLEQVIFGLGASRDASKSPYQQLVHASLQTIAQQVGLPSDFDWQPYLANAAMTFQQGLGGERAGGGFDVRSDNAAVLVKGAVESATQQYPQLQQTLPLVQEGGPLWQQGEDLRVNYSDYLRERKSDNFKKFALTTALAFGGGALLGGMSGAGSTAAGAGGSTAAGTGAGLAGTEATLGTGITTGATGASGLSTAAGGASGISATGAAGTSLAPGFFSAEGLSAAGSLASALNSSGGSTTSGTGTTGTSSGGMVPGVGEYGELGMAGWEGGIPGGPGVTTAAQQTALGKILAGTATPEDYLKVFGQVAPSLLGMYASDKQADKLGALAAQYQAMGAPYRGRLEDLYSDPTAFLKSPEVRVPVQMGTDALARALSTQGNPAGSGTALQELQNYSANQLFGRLGQEKDRLAGFGGLTAYNSAAPQAATNAIGAERGFYDALGYGVGAVTQPPRSLADILRQYNTSQGLA